MLALESRPEWVKTSLSFANGDCVEVAVLQSGEVGVRNSRDAAGAVLCFTPEEWDAFLGGARNGEFDRFDFRLGISGIPRERVSGGWPPVVKAPACLATWPPETRTRPGSSLRTPAGRPPGR
jgi:Domain of unknown function (DUF397)